MISVRDELFKPFFKIVQDTGQQLTIDRTNFVTDGFLQIIQRTGFVSINPRFKIPPPPKSRWKIGWAGGGGATARLRNGKFGARGTCFEQWSLTRLQCALWHHLVETTQWHSLFFFGAVPPPPRSTYWVLPNQRCRVPVGHPVYVVTWSLKLFCSFFMVCWSCFLSQPVHGTATYRCDDTRCCIIQFWPPDNEHILLETCRGI